MICKQDVLLWFEKLESYNRIETMYALLTACLPFELRFLGTLLEEQGRCDSETLRGMELRANNPQELAADMFTCQKGDPTDRKIRRKMALYLALIRACNRNCVSEIYRTLECWGECDFGCINDQDTLLELLLVYTMAAIHPVFSMDEQKKIFGILGKIKENKLVSENFPQAQMEQPPTPAHPHPPHPHAPSQHDLIMQQQQQQQHQQQQQQQHFQNNAYMNSLMQNMSMNDDGSGSMTKSVATTGSESGSSNGSCGDISPPETPTPHPLPLHSTVGNPGMGMVTTVVHSGMGGGYQQKHHLTYKQQQQQMSLQQRLNGRNGMEKSYQQIYTTGTPSNVSDAQTMSSGNMQQQQALLISPSSVSTPTTTVLLQQQPQQQQPPPPTAYNAASYPYHTRGPPPQQTIFQAHNAPPPPQSVRGGYRFPMAPVSHNGELIYPAFHTSLAFLPVPGTGGTPTAVTPPQLQNTAAVVSTNAVAVQTPAPQQQQLPTTPPYSALTVCPITGVGGGGAPKISCYNCGSQTHIGRDCQEASMEDVTRSASYKLDYSEPQSIEANSIGDHSNKDMGSIQMNMNSSVTAPTASTVLSAASAAVTTIGK
ncbi:basic-leucine zipper transcription factor A isoform X3 [Drosophila guanche]|uniref:basic-leucine zipper transcription factor A isoform X3 n=1 Tax=Drosophila guanche TaxID=7266 RepID=UPI00147211B7|nr:basic-leucine zipper transcription factor A isoform X3 [Drosophila guanche]